MKLSSKLSIARSILLASITNNKTPLSVYLILTNYCPHRCTYCNYEEVESDRELNESQWLLLIDQMAEAGTKKLQISGGEPLTKKSLGPIIRRAKNHGMFVGVSTSGFLVDKNINTLGELDILFLSLDGRKSIHDELRGKGSYEMVLRAASLLHKNAIPFWYTTVLNRKNLGEIDHLLDIAEKQNTFVNFIFLDYQGNEGETHLPSVDKVGDLVLSDNEIRTAIKTILKAKNEGRPVGSSYEYYDYLYQWGDHQKIYNENNHYGINCWAGKLFAFIFPDGMVYPCGDLYWRSSGINALEKGFKKAFDLAQNIPCKSCKKACYIEQNLFFSLNIRSIWNWGKVFFKLNGHHG
jgi:MoaA/NifB/PqqE/SkfB family radical SAM enzyme